ncbi:MAG: sugar O-acetyltransferase [Bacillota bacterium]
MKSEKEKMLAGKLYNSNDPELVKDRKRAKKLCTEFNKLEANNIEKRKIILKKLFNTDNDCYIEPNFFCDYGYNIDIGENFYANHNCVILDVNKVKIGDNVFFGPAVQIYTASHPIKVKKRNSGNEFGFEVAIGDNVWIGGGAIINPGIKIGDNSVIASGSVVTKDFPKNVIVGGNPAKIIREINNS